MGHPPSTISFSSKYTLAILMVTLVAVAPTAIVGTTATVAAQPAPGPLPVVTALQAPTSATAGTQITVTARIRNIGSSTAVPKIDYRFDGQTLVSKSRTLNAGGSDTVTFLVRVPDVAPGEYTHGIYIRGTDANQTATIRVDQSVPTLYISEWRAPQHVSPGDRVTVAATVVNTGSGPIQTPVQYRIDGEVISQQTVSLEPGAAQQVVFSVTIPELAAGTHQHGVYIGDRAVGQSSRMLVEGDASFQITNLDVPDSATVGDRIRIAATVTNAGTAPGSSQVQYRIGGSTVASQVVELGPGASTRVVFSVRVPTLAGGQYTQGVYLENTLVGQQSTLAVSEAIVTIPRQTATPPTVGATTPKQVQSETPSPTEATTQTPTTTPRGLAGFGVLAVVLAVLVTVVVARRTTWRR